MTSSGEGKIFTIPSIEDIRKYELTKEANKPLLFTKQQQKSNEGTSEGVSDHVMTTTATGSNVGTTSTAVAAAAVTTTSTYCITANPVQRQNPVVRFIRNIPVTFDDIIPDFVLGKTTCALFLR